MLSVLDHRVTLQETYKPLALLWDAASGKDGISNRGKQANLFDTFIIMPQPLPSALL